MYKIIAIPVRFVKSNILKSTVNGEISLIDDLDFHQLASGNFIKLGLYVVPENEIPECKSYIVVDENGNYHSAIADSLENNKPNIPEWLIRAWIKNPDILFNVKIDPETGRLSFDLNQEENFNFQTFLDKIKVTVDDFDVVQLSGRNNFILRHKKSGKVVILKRKFHKNFFAKKPYQVQKQVWKFGENSKEVLVLKPFFDIVIL